MVKYRTPDGRVGYASPDLVPKAATIESKRYEPSGRVTIQSSSNIPVSALFTVLEEILEVNGLSAVKSGGFYKIVPTGQARSTRAERLPSSTLTDMALTGAPKPMLV